MSASASTNHPHKVHEELANEFADRRTHLLPLETPASDLSFSTASRTCQAHDDESPSSSRSASVSQVCSRACDPQNEPMPSTLTSNISAVCRTRVRDEPASSTVWTSTALDSREVAARMDSTKVRIVLDMGYSLDLIRVVIQMRLATREGDHETPEQLLNDIFRTHDKQHKASSA